MNRESDGICLGLGEELTLAKPWTLKDQCYPHPLLLHYIHQVLSITLHTSDAFINDVFLFLHPVSLLIKKIQVLA